MNVMRLVANTMRRQTSVFKATSATGQPVIANPETEPHKYEIQILAMYNLSSSTTNSPDERIHGIAKMGHLCWTGGQEAAEFAGKLYLPALVAILDKESESQQVKLQVIKTLSEFCYGCKKNQNLARDLSLIGTLIEQMCTNEEDSEMRRWCLHTLFFLLIGNEFNQLEALKNPNFERCVNNGKSDSWEGWEHNEASEIVSMLKLNLS